LGDFPLVLKTIAISKHAREIEVVADCAEGCHVADVAGDYHGAHVEISGRISRQGSSHVHRRLSAGLFEPCLPHNAQVSVYMLEGSVVMQVRGGKEVTLRPGQSFYEDPNDIHVVSRNASSTKSARFLVFLIHKKGAPLVMPAK
jgi:hypothetical protein